MGTWGTAIFADDTAADVRDEYRDLLGEGMSGAEATDRLMASWQPDDDDPDDGPIFWLSLAAAQARLGRLEPRVRDKALMVIGEGLDLPRWMENPKALAARRRVLEALRKDLLAPPRPETPVKRRVKSVSPFAVRDTFAYRLDDGRYAVFRCFGVDTAPSGTYPYLEVLEWLGPVPPDPSAAASLPLHHQLPIARPPHWPYPAKDPPAFRQPCYLIVAGSIRNWRSRVFPLARSQPLTTTTPVAVNGITWKRLGHDLAWLFWGATYPWPAPEKNLDQ